MSRLDVNRPAVSNPTICAPTVAPDERAVPIPGSRSKRIAFFGFYGRHNFGDDLFGYLLQAICARIPGVRPLIVGASPQKELTNQFNLPIARGLWTHPGIFGAAVRTLTYLSALMRSHAVVFGGGSLFGADASIVFAKLIVFAGIRLDKPVAAVGVSIGPFRTAERRRAFLEIIRRIPHIAVRDEASISAVAETKNIPPPNLGDLAFSLPAIYTPKRATNRKRTLVVSVHLREYTDTVLAILAEVDSRRLVDEIIFASLDDESLAVTGDIARIFVPLNVSIDRFKYGDSITEVIDLVASASCVVTSKLHGAIVSYVYDIPALLFCYQRKCAEFLSDNTLPGPRETHPSDDVCIEHVTALLTSSSPPRKYQHAQLHLGQFIDFLSAMADAPQRAIVTTVKV
jgi:polysaccharide pyruvyl transferase WcaK-like protein